MQTESQNKKFRTRDHRLTSYVEARDPNTHFQEVSPRPGKVEFVTDATDTVYKLVSEFNCNSPIPVQDFIQAEQSVKDRMMDLLRSQQAGGGAR